jgi:hypothetical protein
MMYVNALETTTVQDGCVLYVYFCDHMTELAGLLANDQSAFYPSHDTAAKPALQSLEIHHKITLFKST